MALEEATQLLDVRDGRTPTTNHVVLDFLKPLPQVPATLPAQLAERSAYVPPNALCTDGQPEDVAVNVQNALQFLRQLALHPDRGVDNVSFFAAWHGAYHFKMHSVQTRNLPEVIISLHDIENSLVVSTLNSEQVCTNWCVMNGMPSSLSLGVSSQVAAPALGGARGAEEIMAVTM